MSRRSRLAAAAVAAAVLAGGGAAYAVASGSPPAPLSRACRAAQIREEAAAGLTRAAGQTSDTGLYLAYQRQEGRTLRAMKAAGCPADTKVAGPY